MSRVATAWRWLLAKVRDRRTQLRLCLRLTVAAVRSLVLASLHLLLAGLWAVLTSRRRDRDEPRRLAEADDRRSVGKTLGGAGSSRWGNCDPGHHDEISLRPALALACRAACAACGGGLAFSRRAVHGRHCGSKGRRGPTPTRSARRPPIACSRSRSAASLASMVSFPVLAARAHLLVIDAAADMLGLLARASSRPVLRLHPGPRCSGGPTVPEQHRAVFPRVDGVGAEAKREQIDLISCGELDSGPSSRTLLRLRHDLVMIGRAAAVPFLSGSMRWTAACGRRRDCGRLSARRPPGAYRAPRFTSARRGRSGARFMPPRSPLRAAND